MTEHVNPAEVEQLADVLHEAIAGLCAPCSGIPAGVVDRLIDTYNEWAAQPLDWLSAPMLLFEGLAIERAVSKLQGPRARRYNTGPVTGQATSSSSSSTPATPPPTHGIVTPGDVLSYRSLWDSYVMGTARAAQQCSQAWAAAAAAYPAAPPAAINTARYGAHPPDASILQLIADTEQSYSDGITTRWNIHADTPDATLLLNAGSILQDFQDTVLRVGQFYQPLIADDCPAIALPMAPDASLQSQVIARIEGLGIVAHGVLQLLGIGAGGALDTLGAIGGAVAQGAKTLTSPGPWIALGLAGAGVLVLALRR